jgi:uncharacterized OB-fold protein
MTTTPDPLGSPDRVFQKYLAEGRFMIQRGVRSGTYVYYPRTVAPITGEALEWVEPSGLGTVYATTTVRKRPPEPSINLALVDLDEGPRMMTHVEGIDPDDVKIGMRVKAAVRPCTAPGTEEDIRIVVFRPAGESQ